MDFVLKHTNRRTAQIRKSHHDTIVSIAHLHDSYDRKNCHELKQAEEVLQRKELDKLRDTEKKDSGVWFGSMSSLNSTNTKDSNATHASYSSRGTSEKSELETQFHNQNEMLKNLFASQTEEMRKNVKRDIIIAKAEIAQEFDNKLLESEERIKNQIYTMINNGIVPKNGDISSNVHSKISLENYIDKYLNIEKEKIANA